MYGITQQCTATCLDNSDVDIAHFAHPLEVISIIKNVDIKFCNRLEVIRASVCFFSNDRAVFPYKYYKL